MSPRLAKILVIDDEKSICLVCRRILQADGHQVEAAYTGKEGVAKAVAGDHALVLLDLKMPDLCGLDALRQIKAKRPDLSVIIITGYATIQTSIEAIKMGAFHYVPKPFTPEELSVAVAKALEDREMRDENAYLKQEISRLKKSTQLLGRSREMDDIRRQILKVAPSDFTVTIYGESGTGKELVARAIHDHSLRAEKPFMAVDISALTAGLLESELFGHVRGAFTGATQSRPGYFSIASGGTLFLDEISNLSLEVQGKLLRAVETRKVRPVGSEQEHEIDVRIIAATNRDLYQLVEQGRFREDLYYRLNVIPLTVPPLRERPDDIPLLAMHFLRQANEHAHTRVQGFTTAGMARLIAYHWPGNVRQLKNIVERLVATVDQELVGVEQLPPEIGGGVTVGEAPDLSTVPENVEALKEVKRRLRDQVYEKVESQFVAHALQRSGGNVSRAADAVGMQRTNFHALMRKYGIHAAQGTSKPTDEA